MIPRKTALTALGISLFLINSLAILFQRYPGIDLAVSDHFTNHAHRFFEQSIPALQWLRLVFRMATDGTMAGLALLLVAGCIRPNLSIIRAKLLTFALLVYVLVPGLIVNLGLKDHWGRARPRNVLEYGGTQHFTSALQISHECASNCSFVSGEASALFTILTLILLILVPRLARGSRPAAILWATLAATMGSYLRVMFGAHFASDVIFAALLSVAATLAIYVLSGLYADRGPLLTPRWGARYDLWRQRPRDIRGPGLAKPGFERGRGIGAARASDPST